MRGLLCSPGKTRQTNKRGHTVASASNAGVYVRVCRTAVSLVAHERKDVPNPCPIFVYHKCLNAPFLLEPLVLNVDDGAQDLQRGPSTEQEE